MSGPLLAHLLCVEVETEHGGSAWSPPAAVPGWLLRVKTGASKRLGGLRWNRNVRAWWGTESMAPVMMVEAELAASPRSIVYCADCSKGIACEAWDEDELRHEGFFAAPVEVAETEAEATARATWARVEAWFEAQARQWAESAAGRRDATSADVAAAAAVLGVVWPCSHEQMTQAFRAAALRAHPDQGGNDEAIRRVVAARATLERAIGATK